MIKMFGVIFIVYSVCCPKVSVLIFRPYLSSVSVRCRFSVALVLVVAAGISPALQCYLSVTASQS